METGAPTPDANTLSDEELEKLTAPDQGDQIASAAAPGSDAVPETPNAQSDVAAEEAPAGDQPSAPSGADLDAHLADAGAVATAGGEPVPPTPTPDADPAVPAAPEPPANTPNPVTPQIPAVPETTAAVTPPTPPAVVPKTTSEPVPAPEHQFTGTSVKVHIAIKDFDLFDHTFQVSTEPIVEIINRVAKAKFGCDITLLDGLRIFVHGEEVATTSQAHTLGFEDEANIEVTYD
jgi:hypothetical protein